VKKNGKSFFFIRTNIDQDLYNEKIDHPSTYNESVVLNRIRENCLAHVQTVDETASVFLISGRINHTSR
jgi:Interferon-inducible GTPase (IIGP)